MELITSFHKQHAFESILTVHMFYCHIWTLSKDGFLFSYSDENGDEIMYTFYETLLQRDDQWLNISVF